MKFSIHSIFQDRRAQGMVEFALALPVFLLLVLGVFEFGYLLAVVASVNTAAREGARYGSASSAYMDCNGIIDTANRVGFLARPITVHIGYNDTDSNPSLGDPASYAADHQCGGFTINPDSTEVPRIIVQVSTQFNFLVLPLHGFPISAQSARTIINNVVFKETPVAGGGAPTATTAVQQTATSTPAEEPTATATVVEPTQVPYCQFLRADPGVTNTTPPQSFAFIIHNSSVGIDARITAAMISWEAKNSAHAINLTEIDYQGFKRLLNVENPPNTTYTSDALPESNDLIVAPSTIATPPPPDFRFYFTAVKGDPVTVISAKLLLTYQDPNTNETVNCALQPGQTATRLP